MTDGPRGVLAEFLGSGSPEEIVRILNERGTSFDSANGKAAQVACIVLASREIVKSAERLDEAATKLHKHALGLAWASLAISVAALVVAILGGR